MKIYTYKAGTDRISVYDRWYTRRSTTLGGRGKRGPDEEMVDQSNIFIYRPFRKNLFRRRKICYSIIVNRT